MLRHTSKKNLIHSLLWVVLLNYSIAHSEEVPIAFTNVKVEREVFETGPHTVTHPGWICSNGSELKIIKILAILSQNNLDLDNYKNINKMLKDNAGFLFDDSGSQSVSVPPGTTKAVNFTDCFSKKALQIKLKAVLENYRALREERILAIRLFNARQAERRKRTEQGLDDSFIIAFGNNNPVELDRENFGALDTLAGMTETSLTYSPFFPANQSVFDVPLPADLEKLDRPRRKFDTPQ